MAIYTYNFDTDAEGVTVTAPIANGTDPVPGDFFALSNSNSTSTNGVRRSTGPAPSSGIGPDAPASGASMIYREASSSSAATTCYVQLPDTYDTTTAFGLRVAFQYMHRSGDATPRLVWQYLPDGADTTTGWVDVEVTTTPYQTDSAWTAGVFNLKDDYSVSDQSAIKIRWAWEQNNGTTWHNDQALDEIVISELTEADTTPELTDVDTTPNNSSSLLTHTRSYTLAEYPNRMVLLGIGSNLFYEAAELDASPIGVTFNGVAMTKIGSANEYTSSETITTVISAWAILEADLPVAGTYDIVATYDFDGGENYARIMTAYTGYHVLQEIPSLYYAQTFNTAADAQSQVNLTTVDPETIVVMYAFNSDSGYGTFNSIDTDTHAEQFQWVDHNSAIEWLSTERYHPIAGLSENAYTTSSGQSAAITIALPGISNAPATGLVGSSTLVGTGSLGSNATVSKSASATLTGTGSIAGTQSVSKSASATLIGVGSITPDPNVQKFASAALSGIGSIGAVGYVIKSASAALSGVGHVSYNPNIYKPASATLQANGSFGSNAIVYKSASASLTSSGALSAHGAVQRHASATLSATGGLSMVSKTVSETAGSGTLRGFGFISTHNTHNQRAKASLQGIGSLQSNGRITLALSGSFGTTATRETAGAKVRVTTTGAIRSLGNSLGQTGIGSIGVTTTHVSFGTGKYIHVNDAGIWKDAVPWIRINDVWTQAIAVYRRVSGIWRKAY